ncbi:MAG TPA: hypothetical protein VJ692_16300 [Nitrospiraceae bacterium]|nr:hypothetical protein [Nitrospiraceae bacterium]
MNQYRFGDPFEHGRRWRGRWPTQPAEFPGPRGAAWPERAGRQFQAQIAELRSFCTGRASRTRLTRLIGYLSSPYQGASESAHAELDLAIRLIHAGFRVEFLPESQSRTADLECTYAEERIFVEITAMVGSSRRRQPYPARYLRDVDEDGVDQAAQMLIHRILARISQKAKQLADYCAPVVLAISLCDGDKALYGGSQAFHRKGAGRYRPEEVDLKRLSGAVIVTLPAMRHVSAVLLSLWNVEPVAMRSGVRLAHVSMVERPRRQNASPRVRMLILNPAARSPLATPVVESFKSLL